MVYPPSPLPAYITTLTKYPGPCGIRLYLEFNIAGCYARDGHRKIRTRNDPILSRIILDMPPRVTNFCFFEFYLARFTIGQPPLHRMQIERLQGRYAPRLSSRLRALSPACITRSAQICQVGRLMIISSTF
jgi:hypothetical protein